MQLERRYLIVAPVVLVLIAAFAVMRRGAPDVEPVAPPSAPSAGARPERVPVRPNNPPTLPEPKGTQSGRVSLLELLALDKDVVSGEWRLSEGRLVSPAAKYARIQFPCVPPEEYDLELHATRVSHTDSLVLGVVFLGKQCQVVLDGNNGASSWLWVKDGSKGVNDNGVTYFQGPVLRPNRSNQIAVSVRKGRLTVTVDGFVILDWRGGSEKLSLMEHWGVRDQRTIFLGSWQSSFGIERVVLTPLQGKVSLLR
jgi:hypothetical protein